MDLTPEDMETPSEHELVEELLPENEVESDGDGTDNDEEDESDVLGENFIDPEKEENLKILFAFSFRSFFFMSIFLLKIIMKQKILPNTSIKRTYNKSRSSYSFA